MSPPSSVIAIPSRLPALVDEMRAGGFEQPAVQVDHDRWRRALGRHAHVLESLPVELDRERGRAFAISRPETQDGALEAFIASQIWGYGATGYGPHRLGKALAHPGLGEILHKARTQLADADPIGAFRTVCVETRSLTSAWHSGAVPVRLRRARSGPHTRLAPSRMANRACWRDSARRS